MDVNCLHCDSGMLCEDSHLSQCGSLCLYNVKGKYPVLFILFPSNYLYAILLDRVTIVLFQYHPVSPITTNGLILPIKP